MAFEVAAALTEMTAGFGIPYVFKASFDKANRTSPDGFRGPGLRDGLQVLGEVKQRFAIPVLSDIHEPSQAAAAAEVVDILQIPAFLCRQTDLLVAAGETGKAVNIKKGQFLDPWAMRHACEKVFRTGNRRVILTERGSTFGYNDLVVDMRNLPRMRQLGVPVVFDATHSVQRPSAEGDRSGGTREFVPHLTRAAIAVGVDGIFLEVHPEPDRALSDAANAIDFATLRSILEFMQAFGSLASPAGPALSPGMLGRGA